MSPIIFFAPCTPKGQPRVKACRRGAFTRVLIDNYQYQAYWHNMSRGSPLKATNEQLTTSYAHTKSLWKTAEEFGMCGQSVHERLVKLGIIEKPVYTEEHREIIRSAYERGFLKGDGTLDRLAAITGHHKTNICRLARTMKLTNPSRSPTLERSIEMGIFVKRSHIQNGHPKGMLGKHHPPGALAAISAASKASWKAKTKDEQAAITLKSMKTRVAKGIKNTMSRANASWKSGWREVGGVRFYARSRWEANYARYLQFLQEKGEITKWEHEPETFWFEAIKRGCRSYLPDFRVTLKDGGIEYHEMKGWMDARSITKIKRMKKYHPSVILIVLDAKWYRANSPTLRAIIKEWER